MAGYPSIEPYAHGMLDVGDGNLVYWECSGNPDGKPVVVLHGGPGSGSSPGRRRWFDPRAYRIVQFDQRGCGRSTPLAVDPSVDLSTNTTQHLIADTELLREHLGIDRWQINGSSWGSTLALAYAQAHPHRVTDIVLVAVTNTTRREVRWLTRDAGRLFPAEWARFRDGVPPEDRDGDLADAYARLLNHPDPAVREKAALDWCAWEDTHIATTPDYRPSPRYQDPTFRMVFARLVTHYWRHAGFLDDGILLREAGKLAGIPAILIHGRLDFSGPPDIAWNLHRVWPDSELVLLDQAGHASGVGIYESIIAATDRFAATQP